MKLKILGLIILLVGIFVGIILVKQSQNVRSKAANNSDYDSCLSDCLFRSNLPIDPNDPRSAGCKRA